MMTTMLGNICMVSMSRLFQRDDTDVRKKL